MSAKPNRTDMTNLALDIVFDHYGFEEETTALELFVEERSAQFNARFARYYRLLNFVASQVLGGAEGVEEAIERCRIKASQTRADSEQEGAFRSWLVRVLIDEALAIRAHGEEIDLLSSEVKR